MKSPILLITIALVMFSCKTETDIPIEINDEKVTVHLSPSSVLTSEYDIESGRTPQPDDTYVLLSISNSSVGRYASAVYDPATFDTLQSIIMELDDAAGLSYNLSVSAFRKGVSAYGLRVTDNGADGSIRVDGNVVNITNALELNDTYLPQGRFGFTEIYESADSTDYYYHTGAQLMDAYFGQTSFAIDGINDGDTIELDMDRQLFGIEIVANNINNDSIRVNFSNWGIDLFLDNATDSLYQERCFQYDGSNIGSTVNIYHIPDGGTEDLIFTGYQTFNRLKVKRFEINVPAGPDSDFNNPFEINIVEEPLTPGDTVVIGG